jgi:hypothetical protein
VHCPECGAETGVLGRLEGRWANVRRNMRLYSNASGAEDGFRCVVHSRTERERWRESRRALRLVPGLAGVGGGD